MKHRYLLFIAILYCCIIAACKLDPPILPGDKDYIANADNTLPGSRDTTRNTDTAKKDRPPITGFWFCKSNTAEIYSQLGVLQSSAAADPFYYSITFDSLKNVAAFKLTPSEHPEPNNYNYTVTKDAGKTYITFDEDPFFRDANTPVEILNETAVSMIWLIVDHRLHDSANGKTYTASRLELVKIK
ncbi:hypothetical protein [Mucilaginibacter panaciglaebae]|uniref:Lipocalin-like domain-containing protein n=1 Tax=Mucilaginibacter panaciglaebae TaxID=502331 RepID=A0ABP7WMM2_9SPHI